MIARLGRGIVSGAVNVYRACHNALARARHGGGSVRAVEIFLKGQLRAVLTHAGVEAVAEVLVFFIVRVRHQTRVAKDVGGILGVILADVADRHVHTADARLHQRRDGLDGNVLSEGIVGGVDNIAHVHGVANPRDGAHILGGVVVVDAVARAHLGHDLHGGSVRFQAVCLHPRLHQRGFDVAHVFFEFKRRLFGDGQLVVVAVAMLLDQTAQLKDIGVDARVVAIEKQLVLVDDKVVAVAVGHEQASIAVKHIAARRRHRFIRHDGIGGRLIRLLALDDLQFI